MVGSKRNLVVFKESGMPQQGHFVFWYKTSVDYDPLVKTGNFEHQFMPEAKNWRLTDAGVTLFFGL